MIETNCAACGKQLDYGAPKCVRCKSIYCDAAWLCLDGVARAAAVVGFEKRGDALRAVREVEGMRFGDGTIHAFLRPEDE